MNVSREKVLEALRDLRECYDLDPSRTIVSAAIDLVERIPSAPPAQGWGRESIPQAPTDEAYLDRNLLAMTFARLAQRSGWTVGVGRDPQEPDWPVLYVDTPHGQVSWHLPKDELVGEWPSYASKWDGHSTEEKRLRLAAYTFGTDASRPLGAAWGSEDRMAQEIQLALRADKRLTIGHDYAWEVAKLAAHTIVSKSRPGWTEDKP